MKEIDLPPDLTETSGDLPPKPAKKRRRTKQTVGLEEREYLLRRARRTEQATRMTEWLTTPSSKLKM